MLEARPVPRVSEESVGNLVEHFDVVSVSPVSDFTEVGEEVGESVADVEAETVGVDSKNITVEDETEVTRKI